MTVDVEDYFQVSAFEDRVSRDEWPRFESRVTRNTERLLELFDEAGVRATFFVLGWVGEQHPSLVRRIAQAGHEIASHGFEHRLVYAGDHEAFRRDLRRARDTLQAIAGVPVLGYRAPSYSVTRQSLWALDVLIDEGYAYDASIYPIRHDRYGIPDWTRHAHRIERAGGTIWELPGTTVRRLGMNLPVGGGGYFRILPYAWTRQGIQWVNHVEQQPAVFYIHPWEVDPEQPRLEASAASRFRHYRNLHKTEGRLRRLLQDFQFCTAWELLARLDVQPAMSAPAALAAS
jgi:polysaccharide deacetylase family protein (PEP-CTERM system associated)